MSLKKFTDNDIIINTMRAHPRVEFLIFDSRVFYNSIPEQSGVISHDVYNVPEGHISLYEYNIDRVIDRGTAGKPSTAKSIYPFITKASARASFRTASPTSYSNEFVYGDIITSSYPMSASIHRYYMTNPSARDTVVDNNTGERTSNGKPIHPFYFSLRNRLNFYGSTLSKHYLVESSGDDLDPSRAWNWNKDNQVLNLISIPSIFYGTKVKPGTVSLKWYFTGSLIGELRDAKQNGELIQVGPYGSGGSGSVGGVIMYDEGFIMLTGSWDLSKPGAASMSIPIKSDGTSDVPRWLYFGAGALDGVNQSTAGANFVSASFDLSFRGQTDTQVMTMFTHARRGEVNYSNNPTFIKYGQDKIEISSSAIYQENSNKLLANVVSSSYKGYDADFKRQVYVSKVAIYDEHKNLIGLATLANPVLKAEDEDFTFKLKIDI
tara:strand:- start:1635 stop:2939 length:1305 start_codon:yes stop_codon:yes gene_type:complete